MDNQNYPQNQPQYQQPQYQQPQYQPNYGYQQPVQQSPYGQMYPSNDPQQPMPKTWKTESIIITVLSGTICCNIITLILGIIGIVKANSVETKYRTGDIMGAKNDSSTAKILFIISAVLIAFIAIIYILVFIGAMNDPEFLESLDNGY